MTSLSYPKVEEYGTPPPPSTAKTVGLSLMKPFASSSLFLDDASHWALGTPLNEEMRQSIDFINYQLSNPDITGKQKMANQVSSLAGMVLDPISLALGGIGGKFLGGAAKFTANIVPDSLSAIASGALSRESIDAALKAEIPLFQGNKYAKYLPKNFHDVAERTASSAGMFAGFTAPESFIENYDADQNRLDYGGLAKSITMNGGIGFAFPPIMWALGVIGGKIGAESAEGIEKALTPAEKVKIAENAHAEGKINAEELDFYKGYHEKPAEVGEHHKKAQSILRKENHPVNALTGSIDFPFLTDDELKQLQTFSADELASENTQDYKDVMSSFVSHSALDRMTSMLQENPSMMNGIKAHLDSMVDRLSKRVESLEKSDLVIDKKFTRSVEREQPLSQAKISDMLERGKLSHDELPFVVPENIRKINKAEKDIRKLELLANDYDKEFAKSNRTKFKNKAAKVRERIAEQQSKLDEYKKSNGLKTQAKELKDIQSNLLNGEKLPDKYQLSTDYLRLLDLAHVSPQARKLLEKIKLREQYEQQQALHDVMSNIVKLAEQKMENLANPEKVINYLKERIETASSIPVIQEEMQDRITEMNAVEKQSVDQKEGDIKDKINQINENENISSETKKDFNDLYSRIQQFKGSDKALKDMVDCIMESENVSI